MNFHTTSVLRAQLQAIAEAKTDAEAYEMWADPKRCAIKAYMLIDAKVHYETEVLDIREAAKRAMGSL